MDRNCCLTLSYNYIHQAYCFHRMLTQKYNYALGDPYPSLPAILGQGIELYLTGALLIRAFNSRCYMCMQRCNGMDINKPTKQMSQSYY